jgi:hypothetical protein
MVKVQPEQNADAWRILLFGQHGDALLVLRGERGFRLPELRIPPCQRVAPNLNVEAKRQWNLETVCLTPLDVSGSDFPAGGRYHVMEVCEPEALSRVAPRFTQMSELKENSFADPRDYEAVRRGIELDQGSLGEDGGPFCGFGAFTKISAWVEEQLEPYRLRWDGTFRQMQATASFSLIRFQTNRGAVWFKATGEPNRREFPLTVEIAGQLPSYLPGLLAARPEWNAWLTFEAEGRDLWSSSEPDAWLQAADSLAGLQIASTSCLEQILDAGAHDARLDILLNKAAPFFSAMEAIMEMQSKPSPRRLRVEEIRLVRQRVVEALLAMGTTDVPDCLNHLDLNPGNVFVDSGKSTFLDWAEATVGNPFFSLEYLRQHFLKAVCSAEETEKSFMQSYVKCWSPILSGKAIETMLRVVPLTAIYAFAASALPWQNQNLCRRHDIAAYFRSLARRMLRESELFGGDRTA